MQELPTRIEAFRTVDARSGDYVKTCDVCTMVVVHENEDEAVKLRAARPSGKLDSGITPPTHKVVRTFEQMTPQLTQLKRQRTLNLATCIRRAEAHILRVAGKVVGLNFESGARSC